MKTIDLQPPSTITVKMGEKYGDKRLDTFREISDVDHFQIDTGVLYVWIQVAGKIEFYCMTREWKELVVKNPS